MPDILIRAIDPEASMRIIAALTTDLTREAATRHHATGLGACALGRALTSGLLLATMTKGGERVTVQIRGDGPMGGVTVDATDEGKVRGFVLRAEGGAEPCEGRAQVSRVLGRSGVVNVTRDLGLKERYAGQTALTTGEVDEDVESYLRISEQVPSALGCEVVLVDGAIVASGGVLVQSLPGGLPESVREAQHALRSGLLWEKLRDGNASPDELAAAIYGKPVEVLDARPLRFQCRCSHARALDSLRLLSTVDLDEMIAEDGKAEVQCNFCNEHYIVNREELEAVREVVAKGPRANN